jgi:hypothetical protein
MAENLNVVEGTLNPNPGTAGLETQVPGNPVTVSAAAEATGGLNGSNFIQPDYDQELFAFQSDDTPLMSLMLKAKKVKVNSPEVDHYMIDEARATVVLTAAVTGEPQTATLTLRTEDTNMVPVGTTLLCKGIDGYDEQGNATPGMDLMLYVVSVDASGVPTVRAVNGKRTSGEEYTKIPAIAVGTTLVILSNALYETQKEVDPDLIVPHPTRL